MDVTARIEVFIIHSNINQLRVLGELFLKFRIEVLVNQDKIRIHVKQVCLNAKYGITLRISLYFNLALDLNPENSFSKKSYFS